MSENKTHRQTIADCARTREYAPEYREDGTKMTLAERAALAPTMPLRAATPPTISTRANRYRRHECARVHDFDTMRNFGEDY